MEKNTLQNGLIVTLLLLLPNAFFLLLTPQNVPPETEDQHQLKVKVLEVIEKLGQMGSFILPFFYAFRFDLVMDTVFFGIYCLLMVFYYAGWLRYIVTGRQFRMLFAPMSRVPIPMAITPVLAILAVAVNFHSWPLAISALILGFGHIPVSWLEWQRCLTASQTSRE